MPKFYKYYSVPRIRLRIDLELPIGNWKLRPSRFFILNGSLKIILLGKQPPNKYVVNARG